MISFFVAIQKKYMRLSSFASSETCQFLYSTRATGERIWFSVLTRPMDPVFSLTCYSSRFSNCISSVFCSRNIKATVSWFAILDGQHIRKSSAGKWNETCQKLLLIFVGSPLHIFSYFHMTCLVVWCDHLVYVLPILRVESFLPPRIAF